MCSLNFPISWKSGAGRGGGNRGTRTLCVQVRFPFANEQRNEGYCSNQLEKTIQRLGLGVLPRGLAILHLHRAGEERGLTTERRGFLELRMIEHQNRLLS